jgi:heme O synthase-like polyprenyltransferase
MSPRLKSIEEATNIRHKKPEVNFLIAVTTAAAFALGAPAAAPFPWLAMLQTVMGTLLVASGAGALNQWIERDHDAHIAQNSAPADRCG